MWKIIAIATVFVLSLSQPALSADSDAKCSIWFVKPPIVEKCCQLAPPIDFPTLEPFFREMREKNVSECEFYKKMTEKLKLTKYDKATYKKYFKSVIKDPEWAPIFDKNSDYCVDLVPKFSTIYAKKRSMENCDFKFSLTFTCLAVQGYSECPMKYFMDTPECNDLKSIAKECSKSPDAIIKSLNSIEHLNH